MQDMFIANAMMTMSAQNAMMMQQRMDINHLQSRQRRYSYAEAMRVKEERGKSGPIILREGRDAYYEGNNFGAIKEKEPMFETREIIDWKTQKLLCYIKVVANEEEKSVVIQCEIKKGYMYEDEAEEIIKNQIFSAFLNGFTIIRATVGKNDEIAGKILEGMGFAKNNI